MTDPRQGWSSLLCRWIRSDRGPPAHKRSLHRRSPPPYLRIPPAPKAQSTQRGWSSWGLSTFTRRCDQHYCRPSSLRQMMGRFTRRCSDLKHSRLKKLASREKVLPRALAPLPAVLRSGITPTPRASFAGGAASLLAAFPNTPGNVSCASRLRAGLRPHAGPPQSRFSWRALLPPEALGPVRAAFSSVQENCHPAEPSHPQQARANNSLIS